MNSCNQYIERIHAPARLLPLRLVVVGVALFHFAMLMWEPISYAKQIGEFNIISGILFIYATCSAFIYGVGFIPIYWLWNLLFSPYVTFVILGYFSYLYLFLSI